jgi:glycosyltransferase involved in cell wall biosynthesis
MAARIWLYLREFPPTGEPCNGGMSKAVHGLACGLVGCGLDVTVLCEDGQDSVHRSPAGFEIRCFKREGRTTPTSRLSRSFLQFIESADYPVLAVLNGIFHPRLYVVSRALRKAQVPYVVAPHDPYHPEIFRRRSFIKWVYWYLFEGRMLRRAQRVQVLDLRHAQWLQRLGVYTPVIEVQNGFAEEDVAALPDLQWRTEGDPRLLFLGRMDTNNKGLDVLIDAFRTVLATQPAHLTIQGPDWGDRAALAKKIAHAGLEQHVSLCEPDFDARSTVIIGQHDVFCLPSRFEGFGLSALEAMLAGRVLLVSEIAGIAPHVRESGCGVVVDPEPASVVRGLRQLFERRSQWKEMGLRGRQYAIENLRWDKIAARVAPQYQQLLPSTTAVPAGLQAVKNVTLRVGS